MSDDVVIRAGGLWKRYGLLLPRFVRRGQQRLRSFRDGQRLHDDGPWALRDISFEVRRGEILGVIGRNGAGKSTLLKVLAGVTPPTLGTLDIRGRVFPMIELNAGLHPYLTGRQNVYLLGAVVGFSRKEMQARMPDIEAFCELGDFFDRQVWTYSTGMLARLGFAVAVNVDADILLIDEVLAVGDLGFQKKCYDRIDAIRQGGSTIVLVSHNMRQIQRICDEVMWFEKGGIIEKGEPEPITRSYMEQVTRESYLNGQDEKCQVIWESTGEMTVLEVKTLDRQDREAKEFTTFAPIKVHVAYEAHEALHELILGIGVFTSDMIKVHGINTELAMPDLTLPPGPGTLVCVIPELRLTPGIYFLAMSVKSASSDRTILHGDRIASFCVLPVAETQKSTGLVLAEAEWEIHGPRKAST